jgi:hypothetical protein
MSVLVKATGPLEAIAIDRRLEALGIFASAGEVLHADDLEGSKVKGGMAAIRRAAPAGVLGIEELDRVEKTLSARLFEMVKLGAAGRARDQFRSTAHSMSGLAERIEKLARRPRPMNDAELSSLLRALEHVVELVEGTVESNRLQYAGKTEINQLRRGYSELFRALSYFEERLVKHINEDVLPRQRQTPDRALVKHLSRYEHMMTLLLSDAELFV